MLQEAGRRLDDAMCWRTWYSYLLLCCWFDDDVLKTLARPSFSSSLLIASVAFDCFFCFPFASVC